MIDIQMGIEYIVNVEDIVTYNLHDYISSPATKKQLENSIVFYASLALFFLVIGLVLVKNSIAAFVLLGCLSLVFILLAIVAKSSSLKNLQKRIRELYSNTNSDYIGKHFLSITPEYIKDISESGESFRYWSYIDSIVSLDQYIFIKIKPGLSAFIVPKRAFPDDSSFQLFTEEANKYLKASSASVKLP
jgi:hypothetical protein